MTAEAEPVRDKDVERAPGAVETCQSVEPLGALAFDVLSRYGEGRAVYSGETLIDKRAEFHGVTSEMAKTSAGNVLSILERGAREPLERALVAAFAVSGFAAALEADAEDRGSRIFRFVRHADWLEVSGGFVVYAFVEPLLGESAGEVWREVAQAVVDEAAGRDGGRPAVRARNAARVSALAAADSQGAREALREVIRSAALDEPTRDLASGLAGDGAEVGVVRPRLKGRLGRAPRRGVLELLRLVSGWALLSWLGRGLLFLLGARREAELRIGDEGLEVRTELSLLGRTVREARETWRLDAIDGAARQVRYPSLHLYIGAIALSLGVLLGGLALFDGVRSGELVLGLVAAALVLGGATLDLALDILVPGSKGRVMVDLRARSRAPLRLSRVQLEEADVFLRALRR